MVEQFKADEKAYLKREKVKKENLKRIKTYVKDRTRIIGKTLNIPLID